MTQKHDFLGAGIIKAMSVAAVHNGHLWETLFVLQAELAALFITYHFYLKE